MIVTLGVPLRSCILVCLYDPVAMHYKPLSIGEY